MMSIEEARLKAGFFVGECLDLFGISERTWYRWCQHGAPIWAYRLLHLRAGHLDQFGWKHWQIRSGILYFDGFTSHGYEWEPGELLAYHWTRHNLRGEDRGALPHTPPVAREAGMRGEKRSPHPSQTVE
ncbi:hypothetical protein ULF88_24115 [Halopseudomonas pachastrellae]|nr:hypothetical protein [Halopseudomonas pachastrellae]|tara:strand:- start:5478 stop:5864 length:387 start_codon:yes stop_codon:yes gene_type:complete